MSAESQQPVAFGPFRLDRRGRSLTRAGAEITLGRRAFDIICVLAAAGGEAVSKDALLDQVWPGLTVEENDLQVQISALRKALGDGMIATIPGRGYRLTMVPSGGRLPSDATAGKPSIAVLPFTNMSGDIEQEYFADGVADDIITEPCACQVAVRHRPQLQFCLQGPRRRRKANRQRTERSLYPGGQCSAWGRPSAHHCPTRGR